MRFISILYTGVTVASCAISYYVGRLESKREVRVELNGDGLLVSVEEGLIKNGVWLQDGFAMRAPYVSLIPEPLPARRFFELSQFKSGKVNKWAGVDVMIVNRDSNYFIFPKAGAKLSSESFQKQGPLFPVNTDGK